MTGPDVEEALLISPSLRRQLPTLGAIAAIFCAYLLLGSLDVILPWIEWLGAAVFGLVLIIGFIVALRSRRAPWELRLDADGVTVRGHAVRPWSDFGEVRVSGLRPRWFFFLPQPYRVVSFVGRPDVVLDPLPSAEYRGGLARWAAAKRDRWYGTQLLVTPYAYDTTTEAVVDAVRRFSDVPVRTT
jgi:hypothetical protein